MKKIMKKILIICMISVLICFSLGYAGEGAKTKVRFIDYSIIYLSNGEEICVKEYNIGKFIYTDLYIISAIECNRNEIIIPLDKIIKIRKYFKEKVE